jgi:magnesium-protoporphyrin IX monomethyl ester (oxidative) cyclase
MRVLLIAPPITRPTDFSAEKVRISPFIPIGLAMIAAVLENAGHEVKILDCLIENGAEVTFCDKGFIRYGLTDEEIKDNIRKYKPDYVGVSCMFSAMEADAVNICKIAKSVNYNIRTIMGGAWAGTNRMNILAKNCISINHIIRGEGERVILDIIGQRRYTYHKYIENLDTLPMPAYHLLDMKKYFQLASGHNGYKQKPFMPMLTSRGCPAACSFCSIANHWGKEPRYRSAEHVLREIDFLVKEYGIKEIHFEDDNLTADRDRAIKIFDGLIQRNYGLTWTVPSGMAVHNLDDELLEKMAQSGCYSVSLAVENGNQDIVTKIMKKPILLTKVKPMVDKIRSLGMDVRGFFILGYPGETKENIEDTIGFAKYLQLDWSHFFIFSPLPGTEIYKTCIDNGYLKPGDFDPLRSFYEPILKTPEFDQEYLIDAKERSNIEVNFRHNYNLEHNPTKAVRLFQAVVDMYPHLEFARKSLDEARRKL